MPVPLNLKKIYQVLDFDRPLDYRETADRALYVPNLHGDTVNPINELLVSIQAAERPASWLFTGHRGVGKSTELRWLARLFDNGLILNYRNGSDWCDVHYLLHDQLTTPLPAA